MILRASLYANLALLIACITLYALWQHDAGEVARYETRQAQALADATQAARKAEQQKAKELAAIADAYEKDKRDAEVAQRKLVDDLRAGNVRLQKRWAGCVSDVAASAAELDAAARDREESAARIVRAARDADDQIKGLQDVVRADREK